MRLSPNRHIQLKQLLTCKSSGTIVGACLQVYNRNYEENQTVITNEELGRRVRQARDELGLSQAALGRLLSPPRTHAAVSDIERGKTHLDVEDLSLLATLLKKDLAYFYEEKPVPSAVYRRGDRGLTRQEQQQADQAIEAFKQLARDKARAKREQGGQ